MTTLLEPLTLRCGVSLKNRFALAPLTNGQSGDDGVLSDAESRWLLRRAEGGFGLVSTCAVHVCADGQAFDGELGLFTDAHEHAVKPLAQALVDAECLGIVQLVHGGARCPSRLTGQQPVAPSVFHETTPNFETPRALLLEDIQRIAEAFVDSAVRAFRAGFGGVELHAAHGYLLSEFLSRLHNIRDDGYGGDVAGRARLLREILREVRARTSSTFVIGVRLSPEDGGNARGLDLDDSIQTAVWLAKDGADFIHISLWNAAKMSAKYPEQHSAPLFRAALPKDVALFAAGSIWTAVDARALHERGVDVVAVGRAAIVDPDWIAHVIVDGREPLRTPRTPEQLAAVDVSPAFVRYLGKFPDFVAS